MTGAAALELPQYLLDTYWWAYVHPAGVRLFERQWLVNLILCGNYASLRDAALQALGPALPGRSLQIGCAYGDLTQTLAARLAREGRLDVVDIVPLQLANLARKLGGDPRVRLRLGDSAALRAPRASYDRALIFFLLHEQPEAVRRATLAEALRVVKPGGKIVIVDYHRPSRWHPLATALRLLLPRLEPYALDLWRHPLPHWLPWACAARVRVETFFGGLYQKCVVTVPAP